MSSAAVMAVYAAGYVRTRSAAAQLEGQTEERRRPVVPAALVAATPVSSIAPPAEGEVAAVPAPVKEKEMPVAKAAVPAVAPPVVAAPDEKAEPVLTPVEAPVVVVEKKPEPPPPPATPVWKDGTYTGWGTSRHGRYSGCGGDRRRPDCFRNHRAMPDRAIPVP